MDTKNYINNCMWEITDDGALVIRPANGRTKGTLRRKSYFWPWYGETFKRVRIEGNVATDEDLDNLFSNCPALEDISGIENLDTSRVKSMSRMFCDCPALRTLAGLEKLDTSSVTGMKFTFAGCTALKDITALKDWNIRFVRNTSDMFRGCTSLEDASPLAKWNVTGVRTMYGMFRGCTALRNIDGLEGWDVSNVENMDLIFTDCTRVRTEKMFNGWCLNNRRFHYIAYDEGSLERVVSERRIFAMSDGPMECPREGAFIGWKKCCNGKFVKLLIPADARRSSALNKKCRCDKAQVLEITDRNGSHFETAFSIYDNEFVYRTGKTVSVPDFNEDRFKECAPGIHFFMDKASAVNYYL